MWRDVRMVSLTVVITAIYLAGLIPSKGLVIIPGFTEVRPGSALPVAFSLMFGPAAAWGSAIGNLLGDVFGGTFTAGSAWGFLGNFFMGFVGYKLWGNLRPLSADEEPTMRSVRQVVEYFLIALVTAAGTASIIAWGLDVLGVFPFSALATIIGVNNFVAAAIIGPILLYFLYEPAARAGMTYPAVMEPDQLPDVPADRRRLAAWGIATVAVGWFVLGILGSVLFEGVDLGAIPGDVTAGSAGSPIQLVLGAVAFLALLVFALVSGDRLSAIYRAERD
ncbi:MAG TPA: QueT transporter family protein [Halobacteriales archaeon]|nr:QueT transporter family protein [Halobacteriales archaeon]